MKLYKTKRGAVLQRGEDFVLLDQPWDIIINQEGLAVQLGEAFEKSVKIPAAEAAGWCEHDLLPPIGSQEVWAAGVTYLRSRNARMEESKDSGGADFYDKVYEAERPELFFKSLPHRVAAHEEPVYIRRDSSWNVPEPELTLLSTRRGIYRDIRSATI
jgi:2-dehydro-3-deoxy-D-arabinonate dehydratase